LADPVSIDLFCGAGGLSFGLKHAGIEVSLGADSWKPASDTFAKNFPGVATLGADLREASTREILTAAGLSKPPDLVVGGPPCQGFSSAGARRRDDRRNTLVGRFATIVAELKPRAFLFENVEGFLTSGEGDFVFDLLDPVIEAGYVVQLKKVNVANFGVPQLRKRVIAIGVLGGEPVFPAFLTRAYGAPGASRVGTPELPMTGTVATALASLPTPSADPPGDPPDHWTRPLSETDSARIAQLSPGQTMRDLPASLHHASYRRRAYRRVMDGTPVERRGGAPAGVRRLRPDEPSKAITGAAFREFIHPTANRPLTLRECARLQTFPDTYEFVGSQAEKAVLIGNAVPPRFAQELGNALLLSLKGLVPGASVAGALRSFEATSADGLSPALSNVLAKVKMRYDARTRATLELAWS
jgi:DNA (cytosine-5)-methyltransferase 1